ncbi:MAG TPA: hypothetical protein VE621_14630 [Bryobacteraceae bacterium]|nr:hypothetical protein [Bryobacteraceae bacterium]
MFLAFFLSCFGARTAVLECTSDFGEPEGATRESRTLPLGSGVYMAFRTDTVRTWSLRKAFLLIHLSSPAAPSQLRVETPGRRSTRTYKVQREEGGWLRIDLDRESARAAVRSGLKLHSKSPAEIHTRESVEFSPYLIVEEER